METSHAVQCPKESGILSAGTQGKVSIVHDTSMPCPSQQAGKYKVIVGRTRVYCPAFMLVWFCTTRGAQVCPCPELGIDSRRNC